MKNIFLKIREGKYKVIVLNEMLRQIKLYFRELNALEIHENITLTLTFHSTLI